MKTTTAIFSIILLILLLNNPISIKSQIFQTTWNTETGIPYHQSFDMNTGFHSYALTNDGRIAFLLKQDHRIRIFDKVSKAKLEDISIQSGAKDLCYDNGNLYVLYQNFVTSISLTDGSKDNFNIENGQEYEKISIVNGNVFLYGNNNQTLKYTIGNTSPSLISKNKYFFGNNISLSTIKTSNHGFTLHFNNSEKNFQTVQKLASASVAGYVNGKIYLDVQYIVREVPLKVEREIWIVSIEEGVLNSVSKIRLPDCYYIYVKNDILLNQDGCYYSLTTPSGVEIFKIEEGTIIPLSAEYNSYHFNYHLLLSLEGNSQESKGVKAPITRAQIIANAEPYETHIWNCGANNIKNYTCGGKTVLTPSWVTVGSHHALPYMWGGWSNLSQFDQGIIDGVSAGDCNTTGGGAGASCAVGVDCSGFVSRAWNLSSKYGTSTLPNISTAYSSFSDLLPGDIVNYAGHHVRLIHTLNMDGSFYMIESSASGTDWRVGYNNYTVVSLQGTYIPRYYVDVINTVPDTDPPQTSILTNNWNTTDFDVNFTDTDNSGIQSLFWLPAGLNGSNWTANQQLGFMYNDFNEIINPDWTLVEPTWSFNSGALGQSNEALTNNNAYTTLKQDSTTAYLFNWKMKLSGSGTDRRAGIYIFADSATALQRNNAYMIYYRADLDVCQIYKSVNNSITLMTEDPCVIDETSWFDCKVTYDPANGELIAYLNNVPITSWTDDMPLKTGKYLSLRSGACSALYDEFHVYKSRGGLTTLTVGANKMTDFENPNPTTPACKIYSIAIDLANNFGMTNYTTNIDYSAPAIVTGISDVNPADMDTILVSSAISAFWNPSFDVNSGIKEYGFALGTFPGLADIYPWTSELDTNALCSSVSIVGNQVYYFSVKAVNNAGIESLVSSSDGFLLNSMDKIGSLENTIMVYPNPANDNISFNIPNNINGYLRIMDLSGKTVYEANITNKEFMLSVKEWQQGIYYYSIEFSREQKSVNGKFAIVK